MSICHNLHVSSLDLLFNILAEITTGQFHPDGHLIGLGGSKGQIALYWTKDGTLAAAFEPTSSAPLANISFSENGTFVASANEGSSAVEVRDLRTSSVIKTLEVGGPVGQAKWDYTGQFLGIVSAAGVSVQKYDKKGKSWSEVASLATPGTELAWGADAKKIITIGASGDLMVMA